MNRLKRVSIHAPRAGRDVATTSFIHSLSKFQSTRPVRGATLPKSYSFLRCVCFNPRAPCGARRRISSMRGRASLFQSTRPVRGATPQSAGCQCTSLFQSTRPVRGATEAARIRQQQEAVSIHAPRAGRDSDWRAAQSLCESFNPRAPCGARPSHPWSWTRDRRFNPRAPCGARPIITKNPSRSPEFQSTRPVRGATLFLCSKKYIHKFQSTRPVRGATTMKIIKAFRGGVSIHAPRAGRDVYIS